MEGVSYYQRSFHYQRMGQEVSSMQSLRYKYDQKLTIPKDTSGHR